MGGNTLDMTKGSAWKLIVQFAVPVFLSQVFQQLYNTADALIVGRFLGDEALAAVSASGPLIFLLISFFTGLSMGAGVTISRYFGAGDYDRVSRAIHTDVMLGLLSGVILTVVGVWLTPTFLRWMGTAPEVLPDAIAYFRYYFIGVLAVVMYNMCKSIMNALGDSKRPLYYLIISSLTNIVLDLLFIGAFHWGVWAAAVVSGCASSVPILSDLVGRKPDMTAQVGAENVKQAVGVTNKTNTSSKQETTFKESAVGKVDTSNKKSVTTSSIHANQITADKIEIRNDESGSLIPWLIGGVGLAMLAIGVFGLWRERKNKGA